MVLNSLPQEITLNIFSRLPVESVLDCKLVCRSWRDLIRFHAETTYFAYQHLQQQHGTGFSQEKNLDGSVFTKMSFVLFDKIYQLLYYAEYLEDTNMEQRPPIYQRRRINLKLPVWMFGLVGSCNGLICLSAPVRYKGLEITNEHDGSFDEYPISEEPSYICNPITREFVNLPAICIDKKNTEMGVLIACGFGYHPLTNEYKVVRISYYGASYNLPNTPLHPSGGLVEIYTLGRDREWRGAGETNFFVKYSWGGPSVCWNGSLYWLQEEELGEIVVFDLAEEKFHSIPTPPCRLNLNEDSRKLCVIRSCLCVVYTYDSPNPAYELWLLKENEEDESITSYRMNKQPYKSRSWKKELCIQRTLGEDNFALDSLFALTKGSELLIHHKDEIIRYNLNTKTTTKLLVPADIYKWYSMVPVSHIKSFVSLKALGERDVETIPRLKET